MALRTPRTGGVKRCLFQRRQKRGTLDSLDVQILNILRDAFIWDVFFSLQLPFFLFLLGLKKCRVGLFTTAQIQRNLLQLSVFQHSGWSSTIPKALGRAVISWLSEHNGWKLSYYLSVLSKGKGSCGAERPRKSLVLILLKGVGQPSQILFS